MLPAALRAPQIARPLLAPVPCFLSPEATRLPSAASPPTPAPSPTPLPVLQMPSTLSVLLLAALCALANAQSWSSSATNTASVTASQTASVTSTVTSTPSKSSSGTASATYTPLPCPLRLFPRHDIIGTVLSESFQPSEAACMLNCCNVADLCVGYSFQASMLGSEIRTSVVSVTSMSNGTQSDVFGNNCVPAQGLTPMSSPTSPSLAWTLSCNYPAMNTPDNQFNGNGGGCYVRRPDGSSISSSSCGNYRCCIAEETMTATVFGCSPPTYTCGDNSNMGNVINRRPPSYSPLRDTRTFLISSGLVPSTVGATITAKCILLSSIDQLIPSNGWAGGIKLSALGS